MDGIDMHQKGVPHPPGRIKDNIAERKCQYLDTVKDGHECATSCHLLTETIQPEVLTKKHQFRTEPS